MLRDKRGVASLSHSPDGRVDVAAVCGSALLPR